MSALIVDDYTPCYQQTEPFDVLTDHESGAAFNAARSEALDLCGRCPVRAACWTRATEDEEPWISALTGENARECANCGGKFTTDRRHRWRRYCSDACSLAARRKRAAKCGTDGGYHRHRRQLKEAPCAECTEAHRVAEEQRIANKRSA